jgi:hypothetical protein
MQNQEFRIQNSEFRIQDETASSVLDFGDRIGYYGHSIIGSRLRPRRGAGVVEQGCLLSSYTGKTGIGGSNPPLSATHEYNMMINKDL